VGDAFAKVKDNLTQEKRQQDDRFAVYKDFLDKEMQLEPKLYSIT
jgi:hypothetical protein